MTTIRHPKVNFMCDECKCCCTRTYWEYTTSKNHFCSQRCAKNFRTKHLERPQTGDKRNMLTFVRRIVKKGNCVFYQCLCDCGQQTTIQRNKWGVTRFCANRTNHKGETNGNFKGYKQLSLTQWNSIKTGARKRNLAFSLSIKYAYSLFVKQKCCCAYTGVDLNLSKNKNQEVTASLDRINNTKGYVNGNVCWVHKHINQMKMDTTLSDFKQWCKKVTVYANNN